MKIDSAAFLNSAVLDFMLHPTAVEGEKGLEAFQSLIRVFFIGGGFAVQGNVVSSKEMEEALLHPEKYATLQIRVCGWNEYFVRMSPREQAMFLSQSKG